MTCPPHRLPVAVDADRYDVLVGAGLIDRAAEHIGPLLRRPRVVIVTDDGAGPIWAHRLTEALSKGGTDAATLTLPAGEATKAWGPLARTVDWLIAQGVERSDVVIALGGGVIGDLAGFAAAILKRGCRVVQLPTTLLAQVDSSVGGKTGINTVAGKNLVGAFHHPALVLADIDALATLPERELRAGYAEVVKYGLIDDAPFFAWCQAHGAAVIGGDAASRTKAVALSVAAKARIVAADPTERTGIRALLNLGHTFGHALEAELGYDGRLLHGEAVAAGMALAFGFAAGQGRCAAGDARAVVEHLRAVGLPASLDEAGVAATGAALVAHMAHDKKASGGRVPFVLPTGIGRSRLVTDVDLLDVARFLDSETARAGPGAD